VAIDAETKLIPAFHIGQRLKGDTTKFLWDLYNRIEGRTQITTDGLNHYTEGVPLCFGLDLDFAQLTKMFGDYGQFDTADARYSPPRISGVISKVRAGDPDPDHISTSYVERQNLTMRMAMRRFTRLTNAFSKKLSHLKAAIALHFAYYNFCRVHASLRVTPAMEAGIADHVWSIAELLGAA
jgi:IS1 family transposase